MITNGNGIPIDSYAYFSLLMESWGLVHKPAADDSVKPSPTNICFNFKSFFIFRNNVGGTVDAPISKYSK